MEFVMVKFRIEIDDEHLAELAARLKEMDPVVLKAMTDRLRGKVLDEINTRALGGSTPSTPRPSWCEFSDLR